MWNLYGPTETTIWSTVAPRRRGGRAAVPIGRPIANTRVYVLDARLQPVPVGVAGELYIGGARPGARLSRPAGADRRALRPRPVRRPAGRAGCTGPATSRAGGRTATLEFLGRVDHQVKVRGFRIELGEIEAVLRPHPRRARGGGRGARGRGGDAAAGRLRGRRPRRSRRRLTELRALPGASRCPTTWCPSAFVVLDALPLTPNGKVDRARAAGARQRGRAGSRQCAPARRRSRELLAGIWAEVLGRRARRRRTTTSSSSAATRCSPPRSSRGVREAFGVELPLRALFEAPTVAGARRRASRLRRGASRRIGARRCAGSTRDGRAAAVVRPAAAVVPRPARARQRRLQHAGGRCASTARSTSTALRASAQRDRRAGTRRCARRSRRVDGAPRAGDRPAAVVAAAASSTCRRCRAGDARPRRGGSPPRRRSGRSTWRAGRCCAPPAAARRRASTCSSSTLHHIVVRRLVARRSCVRELGALYAAPAAGRPSLAAELPVQYADYAVWQRELAARRGARRQLAYWRDSSPAPAGARAADRPAAAGASATSRGARLMRRVDALAAAALPRARPRRGRHALHDAAGRLPGPAGALQRAGRHRRRPPIAGRDRAEIEGLIGFFVNTLVLRTDLSGDPTFRELLGRVARDRARRLRAPGRAVRAAGGGAAARSATASRTPLFQVCST